jgi:hypothetical protein
VAQVVATFAAAGFALWLVRVALGQLGESIEARKVAQLPLLTPSGHVMNQGSQGYKPDAASLVLQVKNVGPGLAFAVRASLFPPVATSNNPQYTVTNYHTAADNLPLETQTPRELTFFPGVLELAGTDQIAGNTLEPPNPLVFASQNLPHVVARLTVTYRDIFGQERASAFDWTVNATWVPVGSLNTVITRTFQDINNERVAQRPHVGG